MENLARTSPAIAIVGAAALAIMFAVGSVSATEPPSAPTLAAAATAPDAETRDDDEKKKFSVKCKSGDKKANFSWVEGTVTTRVYYNNHCSHAVKVTVHTGDIQGDYAECWTVKADSKSSKKFQQGMAGTFKGLTKGCVSSP